MRAEVMACAGMTAVKMYAVAQTLKIIRFAQSVMGNAHGQCASPKLNGAKLTRSKAERK